MLCLMKEYHTESGSISVLKLSYTMELPLDDISDLCLTGTGLLR